MIPLVHRIPTPRHPEELSRWGMPLIAPTLYLTLSSLLYLPFWLDPMHVYIGMSNDPIQKAWFFSWTVFALAHHQLPIFSSYLVTSRMLV